jgi:hypothetical protein
VDIIFIFLIAYYPSITLFIPRVFGYSH